jgi:hypothetical protein
LFFHTVVGQGQIASFKLGNGLAGLGELDFQLNDLRFSLLDMASNLGA